MRWCLLMLLAAAALNAQAGPEASVSSGRLSGAKMGEAGAVFVGIPYARPPVGELRWREPQTVKPWSGVRAATERSRGCAQWPIWEFTETTNEDCLYLNVWTPDLHPTHPFPVFVWIHGGGNVAGTASDPAAPDGDGAELARRGIVVVTLDYRLGVFGFLAHPELSRESPHHGSGNYGILDQIAALKWVRENIGQFGGDATNVTIGGESAGAHDSAFLMTSPLARGLFHRVILESGLLGGAGQGDALPRAQAEARGVALQKTVGAKSLAELRTTPAHELLKAYAEQNEGRPPFPAATNLDGYVFRESPSGVFRRGKEDGADLLVGNNAREISSDKPDTALIPALEKDFGASAPQAMRLYGLDRRDRAPDPRLGGAVTQHLTDSWFRCPAVSLANAHAHAGHKTYEYEFDRFPPGRERLGAVHASEVRYVFGTFGSEPDTPYNDTDRAVSNAMQKYWVNFAKTGDPNGPGMPTWPEHRANGGGYVEFTDGGPVAHATALRKAQCDLLDQVAGGGATTDSRK